MALSYDNFPFCTDFAILEKTIEVVVWIEGVAETVRIEALFCPAIFGYKINSFRSELVQGSRVWVDYELPWVMQRSADAALDHALGFLRDRCGPPGKVH